MPEPISFLFRLAEPTDARGIAAMHVRTWQIAYVDYFPAEYLEGQQRFLEPEALQRREEGLANPEWTTLIAEDEGRILGFVTYYANQDELGPEVGEVGALYVDPDYWQRGIGTGLLSAAESGLAGAGYASAILWTIGANDRTRGFYEHQGWRFDGATKPHRTGVELVRYAKPLG